MKQLKKNFLFSNFDPQLSNKKVLKSDLKIENIYNLKADRGIIEPVFNFSNFFKDALKEEFYEQFLNSNQAILNKIIYVTIYEFENLETKQIDKRLFAIDNNFYLYELNFNNYLFNSLSIYFSEFPKILKTNGKLYFYNDSENFVLIDCMHSAVCLTDVPNFTNFANSGTQTFFTIENENTKLYFTELTELENLSTEFENYEYINLNSDGGKILKILLYKDNLYVIQQYSISKVYITTKLIRLQLSCTIASKIFDDTICQIDDYIVFCSSAGLFLFDGNDTKPIFKNVCANFVGNNFISCAYNNNYYLGCKMYVNEVAENILAEFNIENNLCNFFSIGKITKLYSIQTYNNYELLAICKENENYKILRLNNKQLISGSEYLKFNKLTFDDNHTKILNSIKLSCFGNFELKITSDIESIVLKSAEKFEVGNIGLKGHIFEIEILSEDAFYIESIFIEILSVEE